MSRYTVVRDDWGHGGKPPKCAVCRSPGNDPWSGPRPHELLAAGKRWICTHCLRRALESAHDEAPRAVRDMLAEAIKPIEEV